MSSIAIFGAGGRAGRAITAEAHRRGHSVTGVVRDPGRHRDVAADRLVAADVRDLEAVTGIADGHDAVVNAVSPASSPEALAALGPFDEQFFASAADALVLGLERARVGRLVVIGLFANLRGPDERLVQDDPASFPAQLRPFARAHLAGLERLRGVKTDVDWVMLTPPAMLDAAAPRTGRYRVGGDTVQDGRHGTLSYADLAVASIDEIEQPRHHRTRISVFD